MALRFNAGLLSQRWFAEPVRSREFVCNFERNLQVNIRKNATTLASKKAAPM
jgi:hypothetical protein